MNWIKLGEARPNTTNPTYLKDNDGIGSNVIITYINLDHIVKADISDNGQQGLMVTLTSIKPGGSDRFTFHNYDAELILQALNKLA